MCGDGAARLAVSSTAGEDAGVGYEAASRAAVVWDSGIICSCVRPVSGGSSMKGTGTWIMVDPSDARSLETSGKEEGPATGVG